MTVARESSYPLFTQRPVLHLLKLSTGVHCVQLSTLAKKSLQAAVAGGKDDLSLHLWKEPVMTSGWARTRASEHWARGTGASNCPYRVTANLFNAWHTITSLQKVFSWKCSWFKGRDVKGREK